jgi:hypothetical protein
MSDLPRTTNGRVRPPTPEQLEQDLRHRFPPECVYDLMVHIAVRTELYHCAVEHTADKVSDLSERVRRLPCCSPTDPPPCPVAAE